MAISEKTELDYSIGRANLRSELRAVVASAMKPSPRLTGSEWAEQKGRLSAESSSEPGAVRLFGFQKGILDAMTDPTLSRVSVIKSARVGYSMMLRMAMGYYIEHDPSPILAVFPTETSAERFSKSEFRPMLRDVPEMKSLVRPIKRGDSQDTSKEMLFKNGSSIVFRWAAANNSFRALTTRINMADEPDAESWAPSGEGDKLDLLEKRGETFWSSKMIVGSTPTIEGLSRIQQAWEQSDQRHYYVPCPHCGEKQVLEFGGAKELHGLKFDRDDNGNVVDAYFVCKHNGCIIEETHKKWMVDHGEWVAHRPDVQGHAGFHIWTAYSLFPKASWKHIAKAFLKAAKSGDKADLQVFDNLWLGKPWQDIALPRMKSHELFENRCEPYKAEVPRGVCYLVAGVDTQGSNAGNGRFEYEIVGFGRGMESWHVEYGVVDLDPNDPAALNELEARLTRRFQSEDGRQLVVQAAAIDSGGAYSDTVKRFCMRNRQRRWWPVKGLNEAPGTRTSIWPKMPSGNGWKQVYMVGTQSAKDFIARAIRNERPGTPGYMHYPDTMATDWPDYFDQLTAEDPVPVKGVGIQWKNLKSARNEALDTRVYAIAALNGLQMMATGWDLNAYADRLGIPASAPLSEEQNVNRDSDSSGDDGGAGAGPSHEPPEPPPQAPTQPRPRQRPGFQVAYSSVIRR